MLTNYNVQKSFKVYYRNWEELIFTGNNSP